MPKHVVKITAWTPYERNKLQGFATILVREPHLAVNGVAMHQQGKARRAHLPSKPMVQDGQLIHGSDGRVILEFTDRETASAFSCACWAALDAYQRS